MKKLLLIITLLAITILAISRTNDFAVWFNAEKFYRPIYSADFDVMNKETTIKIKLENSYNVKHGFSLVFPCKTVDYRSFTDLDGLLQYKFISNNKLLEKRTIPIPTRPILGTNDGKCDLVLFTFDLPFQKATGDVFLEVTVESPITKLEKYRGSIRCEISPAYWPK
ncbi:MAG: hypothetical protein JEY79_03465 [Pseudodesulfovibrio sp.]|nr:hypothetical protein [Pseudodesulfovibrio sp.]